MSPLARPARKSKLACLNFPDAQYYSPVGSGRGQVHARESDNATVLIGCNHTSCPAQRHTVSNHKVHARFRIALPCAIGALSAVLTAWDVYNWKIIAGMGMAWDTGAPIWPHQTSDILLRLINFPAFVAAMPLANSLGLLAPRYHFVVFPAGLVWWWIVGLGLDLRR